MATAKGKKPQSVVKTHTPTEAPKDVAPAADTAPAPAAAAAQPPTAETSSDAPQTNGGATISADAVRLSAGQNPAVAVTASETLIGSSTFAATYDIGGETVQLGTLVVAAHKRSGLTVAQWNDLSDVHRDAKIGVVLEELQAAAADAARIQASIPALAAIEALLDAYGLSIDWESAGRDVYDKLAGVDPKSLAIYFDPTPNTPGEQKAGGSGDVAAAPADDRPVDVVGFAVREGKLLSLQVDDLLEDGDGAGALKLIDGRLADFKAARPAIDAIEAILRDKRLAIGGDLAIEPRVECWTTELVRWAGKEQPVGAHLELPASVFAKLLASHAVTDQDPNAAKPDEATDAAENAPAQ